MAILTGKQISSLSIVYFFRHRIITVLLEWFIDSGVCMVPPPPQMENMTVPLLSEESGEWQTSQDIQTTQPHFEVQYIVYTVFIDACNCA